MRGRTGGARGIFVTGTDTGVGKTVATGAVVAALRRAGCDAVPMKPVQTGCAAGAGGLLAPDLALACRLAGYAPAPDEKRHLCPYRFEAPCSPHLAARLAGGRIALAAILAAFEAAAARHEFVVVEGAGGLLVPLNDEELLLDLMVRLALPVLVVARPGLGTINHTLLTLRELRRADLRVLGVLFNQTSPAPAGEIERDNAAVVARLGETRILGTIPYLAALTTPEESPPGTPQPLAGALPTGEELLDATRTKWRPRR